MALTLATLSIPASRDQRRYTGGLGAADNNVIVQADDVSGFRDFYVMTTTGAVDINVSLDGTLYSGALSMTDLGSASFAVAVVVTAANRVYHFRGCFQNIRVLQAGATAPEDVALICCR